MQDYRCDVCGTHWQGNNVCPECGEQLEVRKTMSIEQARELGLTEE